MTRHLPKRRPPALALFLATIALGAGCTIIPPEADVAFKAGLQQAESGNVEAAIETLGEGARKYPDHLRMRFELARLQYETGEKFHLEERKALRDSAVFQERGKREEMTAHRRRGNELRARATPFYQAAAGHLRRVADAERDEQRVAWALYLLVRVHVFFEDWDSADQDLERAIEIGKPTGPLLAQWREFQAGIRDKLGGRLVR